MAPVTSSHAEVNSWGVEIGKDAQDAGGPASDVFTESDVTSRG